MKKTLFTLVLVLGLLMTASAQEKGLFGRAPQENYGYSYRGDENRDNPGFGLPGDHGLEGDQTAPLGTGTALLLGFGAAYLVSKRNRKE